jgi:hypothetical protein
MNIIEKYASALSGELAEVRIYDSEKVIPIIITHFKLANRALLEYQMSDYERQHLKVMEEISEHRVGSSKYVELSYKLAALKPLKAAANRMLNNEKRNDKCALLQAELTKQSKERDIFRALLQKHAPDIYENAINDLILGVEADLI